MTDARRIEMEDWTNKRGERFKFACWPSGEPTKALLLIHHGLGEHSGRYHRFAQQLVDLPVEIRAYDVRGHGTSEGQRGHAEGLDGLVDDLEEIIPVMLERSGAESIFLYGHSMGGATVAHYLTTRTPHDAIVGVILSAPGLLIPLSPATKIKLAIGKVLGSVVPKLSLGNGLDPKGISSVEEEVSRYKNDPLVHDRISAGLGVSLVGDGARALDNAHRITLPLLVYQGVGDPIVDIEGSRGLVR